MCDGEAGVVVRVNSRCLRCGWVRDRAEVSIVSELCPIPAYRVFDDNVWAGFGTQRFRARASMCMSQPRRDEDVAAL